MGTNLFLRRCRRRSAFGAGREKVEPHVAVKVWSTAVFLVVTLAGGVALFAVDGVAWDVVGTPAEVVGQDGEGVGLDTLFLAEANRLVDGWSCEAEVSCTVIERGRRGNALPCPSAVFLGEQYFCSV